MSRRNQMVETPAPAAQPTAAERFDAAVNARKATLQAIADAEQQAAVTSDPSDFATANAAAKIGKRDLAKHDAAVDKARADVFTDQRTALVELVGEQFPSLDQGIADTLVIAASAIADVVKASEDREAALALVRNRISQLGEGDGLVGAPVFRAGDYNLRSYKNATMTGLAAALVAPLKALGEPEFAIQMDQRRTAGQKLPQSN